MSVQGRIGHGWNWQRMTTERRVEEDSTLLRFVWSLSMFGWPNGGLASDQECGE